MFEENEEKKIKPSKSLNIMIRFDKEEFDKDNGECVEFLITDDDGNELHSGNDLSEMSDEDLAFTGMILDSVLEFVIEDEFEKRNKFLEEIKKEIDDLIGDKDGK